ncbi:hypothetical protein ACLHDG_04700 [Sulfurovum sp. CS9]|uniref:hypothetical protein n=1 Tax=Sulfurovum sp. CS9 TaxID=3391146 RepID=UPI0039EC31E2
MIKLLNKVWNILFPTDLPYKRMLTIMYVWFFTIVLNYITKYIFEIGISPSIYFPFSMFKPMFHVSGLPYAFLFIFVVYFAIKYKLHNSIISTYMMGIFLIVLGNMSLGNMELAFVNPIAGGDLQYYHDAIKIDSWQNWLSTFNSAQESLLCHAKTHPPGALLIEKLFFTISKSPIWISVVFLFLSSISIVLIYKIFIELGKDKIFSNKMALLYAVIPSVNIYSLATLDAVIAMLVNIVVLGVIIIMESQQKQRLIIWGVLSAASISLVSLLTFASIYLWGVIGVFSFYLFYFYSNKKILILLSISFILFLGTILFLDQVYDYNYVESFFTASRLENPHGFMLFSEPLNYFATRIEDIFEIAIFLSLGVTAVLTTIKHKLQNNLYIILSLIAISMLLLMFLSGAYRTGETARACLFIVSFILIFLKDIPNSLLTSLISFAALQTILMQILGFYFW